MTRLSFTLGSPLGHNANLGLIVLRTDETIESDFRHLINTDGVALYTSRIPCETEVTPNALATMEAALPSAAALLPHALTYDVIGYACTSASAVIGSDAVANVIRSATNVVHVTDPLVAIRAAMTALNVRRLGFLSPYVAEVSETMRQILEGDGVSIASFATFGEESDERIARIEAKSIRDAAQHITRSAHCDALLMSCTNLRATAEIARLEHELGLPIVTSNQALAWHMLKLSGQSTAHLPFGALMQL